MGGQLGPVSVRLGGWSHWIDFNGDTPERTGNFQPVVISIVIGLLGSPLNATSQLPYSLQAGDVSQAKGKELQLGRPEVLA